MFKFVALAVLSLFIYQCLGDLPATIDKSRYPNSISFSDPTSITLYYLLDPVNLEIEVAMECHVAGWCGWGLSRSGIMLNSDVYVGYVLDGVVNVSDYTIGDDRSFDAPICDPQGVCFDVSRGGTDDVLEFNGSESGGVTQWLMRRKYNTGDSLDVVLDPSVTNTVIYAYQPDDDGPLLQQHNIQPTPTPVGFNFFTGTLTKKIDLRVVHGSLMFIAWYCIAPFGFFLARFMKMFSWWFQVHRAIMLIAMLTMLAGFGVIVKESTQHFNVPHKQLGLAIVIMGTAQPIIGFLADKFFDPNRKATPIFPDKTHWVLGWVSIILGMINIILGLQYYGNAGVALTTAYCVIAAVTFGFCVAFTIFRLIKPAGDGHGGSGGDH